MTFIRRILYLNELPLSVVLALLTLYAAPFVLLILGQLFGFHD